MTAFSVDRLPQDSLGYRTESARGPLRVLPMDASSRLREVGDRFLGEDVRNVEL